MFSYIIAFTFIICLWFMRDSLPAILFKQPDAVPPKTKSRPKLVSLVCETDVPPISGEFGDAEVTTHKISFQNLNSVASSVIASKSCLVIITFTRSSLDFAHLLNDSGYFGPVVLFVENELCVSSS